MVAQWLNSHIKSATAEAPSKNTNKIDTALPHNTWSDSCSTDRAKLAHRISQTKELISNHKKKGRLKSTPYYLNGIKVWKF